MGRKKGERFYKFTVETMIAFYGEIQGGMLSSWRDDAGQPTGFDWHVRAGTLARLPALPCNSLIGSLLIATPCWFPMFVLHRGALCAKLYSMLKHTEIEKWSFHEVMQYWTDATSF